MLFRGTKHEESRFIGITISTSPGGGKNNDSKFHTAKNNGGTLLPPSRHNLETSLALLT
jgi:hypothetical protein